MVTMFQATYSNSFPGMKIVVFWFRFDWNVFLRAKFTDAYTHHSVLYDYCPWAKVHKHENMHTHSHTEPRHLCLYNSFICSILFSRPLSHWYHDNIYMIVIHIEMYHLVCNCHLYYRCSMLACIQCSVLSSNRINCPICSALVTIYV